ncbi:hypothetical protein I7I50_04708 [Histoplasma capsulatum G186AR]|uniref:Uncharacterized protein n=1 Tax=Ajellomyces capsulatus TaxID=5037 RepID=A0A8H7YR16_AJECA|nr:hypothetical protein I7I52_05617 [Histoplasma capsulatum]QSS75542.1 hypothetical protein I7I50_04708 [Histoplasma capsulatum G186AR]
MSVDLFLFGALCRQWHFEVPNIQWADLRNPTDLAYNACVLPRFLISSHLRRCIDCHFSNPHVISRRLITVVDGSAVFITGHYSRSYTTRVDDVWATLSKKPS